MLTDKQLEERRQGIGGSDAGAVVGLSKFRTPVAVYLDKIGESEKKADTNATYWGSVLEDVVAQEYARRTGEKVHRRNDPAIHPDPELAFMRANIDRRVVGKKKILECKTAGQYMAYSWGEEGTDQVPDDYLVQVTHYMEVLGAEVADLAVLIGGNDFRIYTIGYDRELADQIKTREFDFWNNYVLPRVPPPCITLDDVTDLYPKDSGDEILATDQIIEHVLNLRATREELAKVEEHKAELELEIKKYMGAASELVDDSNTTLVTWKRSKDSKKLDWRSLKEKKPKLYESFEVPTPGSRRFLVKKEVSK